jgi:hypothetical protein
MRFDFSMLIGLGNALADYIVNETPRIRSSRMWCSRMWCFVMIEFEPLTHTSFRCEVPTKTIIVKRHILQHHILELLKNVYVYLCPERASGVASWALDVPEKFVGARHRVILGNDRDRKVEGMHYALDWHCHRCLRNIHTFCFRVVSSLGHPACLISKLWYRCPRPVNRKVYLFRRRIALAFRTFVNIDIRGTGEADTHQK